MAGNEDMLKGHLKKVDDILKKGNYIGSFKQLDVAKDYAKRNKIENITVAGKEVRAVEEMERMTLEVVKFALENGQYKIARYALDRAKEYAKLNRIDDADEIEKLDRQVDTKAAITIFKIAKQDFANKKYNDALKNLKEADKFAVKAEGKVPPLFNDLRLKIYVESITGKISEVEKLLAEGKKTDAANELTFIGYDIDEARTKLENNPEIEGLAKKIEEMKKAAEN